MVEPNPFSIASNSDGTITVAGHVLSGPAATALVADILAYMAEAGEKAGLHAEATRLSPSEQIHAVRPDQISATQAPKGSDQRLVFVFGLAHLGVVVPTRIVRAMAEQFLALSAPDEGTAH